MDSQTQTVPTESSEPIEPEKKKKKPPQEVKFARPAFGLDLMTEEARKRFDQLPDWQRHLIKRLVDHGDLRRAASEAGVSTYVNKEVDPAVLEKKSIIDALNEGGLTNDKLVYHLLDCLEAKTVRFDKHGNPIAITDLKLKLDTIDLIAKLKGLFDEGKRDTGKKPKEAIDLFPDTKV